MYTPTWKEYEKDMHSNDPKVQVQATEAFLAERDKEMAKSESARAWEAARKEEMAKNKPEWVKRKRAEQKDPAKVIIDDIMNGGRHDFSLKPASGYVLIRVEKPPEEKLANGIIISEEGVGEPNTAEVLAVGGDLILEKNILPTPVKVGVKIVFKKFAGMEITIKGERLRLIQFTDILGELI